MAKRGRKPNPDTPYRIVPHVRKDAGITYAATRTPRTEKRRSMGFKYWGTLVDNVFYPNKDFLYLLPGEQKKFIFPEGTDLSKVASVQRRPLDATVPEDVRDSVKVFGPTWLLEQIVTKIGLREDLVYALDGKEYLADEFLTLSYFVILMELRFIDLENFQRIVKFPTDTRMTEKEISRITGQIDEENRTRLIGARICRFPQGARRMIDSTNISTYTSRRLFAEFCHNKEGLPLRASGLIIICDSEAAAPLFYKEVPGNMPDSRSVADAQREFDELARKNNARTADDAAEIRDRGYASTKVLEDTIVNGRSAIMAWSATDGLALEALKEHPVNRAGLLPGGMQFLRGINAYATQKPVQYTVKTEDGRMVEAQDLRVNLYYDPEERAADAKALEVRLLDEQESARSLMDNRTPVNGSDLDKVRSSHPHLDLLFIKDGPSLAAISFRRRKGCKEEDVTEDERNEAATIVQSGRKVPAQERESLRARLPHITLVYEKDPDAEVFNLTSFRKRKGAAQPSEAVRAELRKLRDGKVTVDVETKARLEREHSCCRLTFTRVRGGKELEDRPYILKSFKVKKTLSNTEMASGFFASITHMLDMDPEAALEAYCERDLQEKIFEMVGELFDKRLRSQTGVTTTGRLFVFFITLIIFSYLRECWKKQDPRNRTFPTTRSILLSMLDITITEHKGEKPVISDFVGDQLEACSLCGVEPPAKCVPGYKSRKVKTKA